MNKILKAVAAFGMVMMMAACTTTGGPEQAGGTLLGGLAGGVAGAQFGKGKGKLWATGAGVLLGAMIGAEVGASLDRADQLALNMQTKRALSPDVPVGHTIAWENPNSGNQIMVTPTRQGYAGDGRFCREYQQTIVVGGRVEEAFGQACRNPDNSWTFAN